MQIWYTNAYYVLKILIIHLYDKPFQANAASTYTELNKNQSCPGNGFITI